MQLPFSRLEFLHVFVEYNQGIWPLQMIAAALGAMAIVLLFIARAWADRTIAAILVVLWTIMGVGYHWLYFSKINSAAILFGALFVVAALVFLVEGVVGKRMRFRMAWDLRGWLASTLFAYSLIVYPIVGLVATHPYPETPLFGVVPCPTTIFTLGLLVLASHPRPLLLAAVPLVWTAIGGSAAILLNVPQDWGLFIAGLIWVGVWIQQRPSESRKAA